MFKHDTVGLSKGRNEMNAYTIIGENSRTIGFVMSAANADEAIELANSGKIVRARGVESFEGESITARAYRPGMDRR